MDETLDLPTNCPYCGEQNEAVTSMRGQHDEPEDGDVTICWKCGKPAIFDSAITDGGIRPPTPDEKRELDRDEGLQQVMQAWRARYQ